MRNNNFKSLALAVLLVFGLGLAVPARAQDVTKPITINRTGKLGGKKLDTGSYQIKFSDDKDGQLSVFQGGREIFRATYRLVKLARPAPDTVVIFSIAADGSYQISSIEFKGMSSSLVIE
jgi:hypothetical protein